MGKNLADKVVSNMVWRFAERCGAQIVTFVVSIILGRILDPKVYGTIALVTVFTTILQVFVDSGLGSALIQDKSTGDLEFSTVFFFNVGFCSVLYIGLFLTAPLIAQFYERPELTSIVRVLGLVLVISGVKNVQQAYVSKHLIFKKFFFSTLTGTVLAAAIGIFLAYKGFGVWALVSQHLVNTLVDTCVLWLTVKWRPKLMFSLKRLKSLWAFGWKMLASSLLNTVYLEIRQLVIGKMYSDADLAMYNRGKHIPDLFSNTVQASINSVLFPTMSQSRDKEGAILKMTRKAIRMSGYIMWPIMIGIAVVAEPLIRILLTEKWIECVPYLRIFCITVGFQPIHTANLNAIKSMGRSDIFLKLEIIKKITGLLILFCVMKYGVFAIACSLIVYNLIVQVINTWPNRRLLSYTYFSQLKDFLPFLGMSLIMCIPVYFIGLIDISDVAKLTLQVICGIAVYLGETFLFKVKEFQEIKELLFRLIKRK